MSNGDIGRDLDEYMSARKKGAGFDVKEFVKKLIGQEKKLDMPEEVEVYHKEDKPPKESFLKKILMREPASEALTRAKMHAEDAVADMKEISKITLNMIRQLPDEQLRNFKKSTDFERLKTILKKNDLIK